MAVRRSSIVLGAVGVVAIVLALLVWFVVVPFASQLPGNTDLKVNYTGTGTVLNASALQSGDTKDIIEKNVPVTVPREVKVTSVHGSTAIVSDDLTIHAGTQTVPDDNVYALNRTTLEGVAPPAGITAAQSAGALTVAFPVASKAGDSYQYYDSTTRKIVPIRYTGTSSIDGRSVNIYKFSAAGLVKDPELLKLLPSALPKSELGGIAPLLPAAALAKFTPAVLGALPDPVPLTYTGTTTIVAYVDQQTGVPISETISQQVVVSVTAGSQAVSLIPVLTLDFHSTPASQQYLANRASSLGRQLTVLQVIVPVALVVLGAIAIVIAVLRRRRPAPATPAGTDSADEPQPQNT